MLEGWKSMPVSVAMAFLASGPGVRFCRKTFCAPLLSAIF